MQIVWAIIFYLAVAAVIVVWFNLEKLPIWWSKIVSDKKEKTWWERNKWLLLRLCAVIVVLGIASPFLYQMFDLEQINTVAAKVTQPVETKEEKQEKEKDEPKKKTQEEIQAEVEKKAEEKKKAEAEQTKWVVEEKKFALRGQFGDSFGVLTFIGVTITILMQMILMRQERSQHLELVAQAKEEARAIREFELFKLWQEKDFQKRLTKVYFDKGKLSNLSRSIKKGISETEKSEIKEYLFQRLIPRIDEDFLGLDYEIWSINQNLTTIYLLETAGAISKEGITKLLGVELSRLINGIDESYSSELFLPIILERLQIETEPDERVKLELVCSSLKDLHENATITRELFKDWTLYKQTPTTTPETPH